MTRGLPSTSRTHTALARRTALLVLSLSFALTSVGRAQPASDEPAPPPTAGSPSSMTSDASAAGAPARTTPAARRRPTPRPAAADAGVAPGASPGTAAAPSPSAPGQATAPGTATTSSPDGAAGTPRGEPTSAAPTPVGTEATRNGGAPAGPATDTDIENEVGGEATSTPEAATAPGSAPDPNRPRPADPLASEGPRAPVVDPDDLDAGVPAATPTDADAGAADAGASVPATPSATLDAGVPEPETDRDSEESPAAAAPPTTTVVQFPVPFPTPGETTDVWAGLRELIPSIPMGGLEPSWLLALLALLFILSSFIERLRGRLLRDGWLPTLLSFTQVSLRLLGLILALGLILQVVPANIRWVVYFILMASGAALGWSMRDVMPDLIAGIIVVFERRIRRGIWIRSDAFSGAVERIGLRSTWLRDSKGHRVAVPNRLLMQAPVVSDEEGERVQEVLVRLGGADAAEVRRALRDAVLASPWTTPGSEPEVLRDPVDPELWQVRGKLLSASFASSFQGQLLERAEAHLAAQRVRGTRREQSAVDDGVSGASGPGGASGAPTSKHTKLDKHEKHDKQTDKHDKQPDKQDKSDKSDKPKTS